MILKTSQICSTTSVLALDSNNLKRHAETLLSRAVNKWCIFLTDLTTNNITSLTYIQIHFEQTKKSHQCCNIFCCFYTFSNVIFYLNFSDYKIKWQ